mgnify:FL=1
MAHFAKIEDGIVVTVEVLNNEVILDENNKEQESLGLTFLQNHYKDTAVWVQTSYNNNFRKNYAGIGHTYDETRDAFYAPQPFPSWTLDEDTCHWEAPITYPDDDKMYYWDEDAYQADNNNGWVERE